MAPERMLRPEHLAYFKDLLEGRASLSWRAWFRKNEHCLSQELSRADFLRLKFHHLDEAERILESAGVDFEKSFLARREKYYALLHDSVLDEYGRPLASFRRQACGGAFGCFFDGDHSGGMKRLKAFFGKSLKLPERERAEAVADFCYDAECEFRYGERAIGHGMLSLLAGLDSGDDLIDPCIFRARNILQAAGHYEKHE